MRRRRGKGGLKDPTGHHGAQARAHYSGKRWEGSAPTEGLWNTDNTAESFYGGVQRFVRCPVFRIIKRVMGLRSGAAEGCGRGSEGKRIKSMEKKKKTRY